MADTFTAWLIEESEPEPAAKLTQLGEDALMDGDVDVRIHASTINYKDGLALTGSAPIARRFPLIPGIDFAGTVTRSDHPSYSPGDMVVATGQGLGETHHGGLSERARVSGDWLVPMPEAMTAGDAMAIGTAGFTAMLCVMALEQAGVTPERGEVVVSGAAGGVGSIATAVLAKLGYSVVASTGRPEEADYLKGLGASEVIGRDDFSGKVRALAKTRWAGGIDVAGSATLAHMLSQTKYGGAVAACGLAQGMDLPGSVAPFILRGVSLLGIDSVMCPRDKRLEAWRRLGSDLDPGQLSSMTSHIGLKEAREVGERVLKGQVRGRVVVDIGS
ncbi:MAG: oxidoreductase [Rhizobiales bacterium]|nr:oxidoreductase [Hyphomicrobiales bacterium]